MTIAIVVAQAKRLVATRVAKVGGDDVVEVDRENGGDDRCLEGGVRPVVHRPCAQLRSSKTEAFQ